ncbi:MAG: hypothetical protein VYE68_04750 [Acidobacteriota bacterium]|nr:hypothetical protein [Acidobacteriota bacterium]
MSDRRLQTHTDLVIVSTGDGLAGRVAAMNREAGKERELAHEAGRRTHPKLTYGQVRQPHRAVIQKVTVPIVVCADRVRAI